jgi:hypothetical protein
MMTGRRYPARSARRRHRAPHRLEADVLETRGVGRAVREKDQDVIAQHKRLSYGDALASAASTASGTPGQARIDEGSS